MLHLQKIRKMAYNPPGKNLKNDDGHPTNDGDGKRCLKIGVYIYRKLLKGGINKKLMTLFSISLSHFKCSL